VLRHQLVDQDSQWYWDHRFLRILVEAEVPSLGYTTVILREADAEGYPVYRQPPMRTEDPFDDMVLENEWIRAVFHRASGCLISLKDKHTGAEYIRPGEEAGVHVVTMERRTNSAWKIGRYIRTELLKEPLSVEPLTGGPLQKSFTATYSWGASRLKVTPILRSGERALCFCIEAEWNEVTGQDTAPLLTFRVPMSFHAEKFLCDVPGGVQYRSARNQDIPALRYCAAIRQDGSALALIPDSKYGYRAEENSLAVSLINTSNNPDPFPDRGVHMVNIALAVSSDDPKVLGDTAAVYDHPLYFLSSSSHKGSLPMEQSYLKLDARSTVLSAVVGSPRGDGLHVRLFETAGTEDSVTLGFAAPVTCSAAVDLRGRQVPSDITVKGREVTLTVKANTIAEIAVTF